MMHRVLIIAALTASVATAAAAPASVLGRPAHDRGPVVATAYGTVRGYGVEGMHAFLGIPYATPPVGRRRWQPPLPPASWTGVRNAWTFANHCAQNADGAFGQGSLSEDCLYLNVFTPKNAAGGSNLPVMVWIHGGGLTNGESDDYDPNRMVPHGVVVVTINYRLGLFGFFAQKGIDAEGHAVMNYGLMDQQQALAWVHQNITAFGGDPSRVTIFGESAGGLSVLSHLASPLSAGLFSGAIAESGGYQTVLPTLKTAEHSGDAIAASLGCASQKASCLRSKSVESILKLTPSENVPATDGQVLPVSPKTAFRTGAFNRVPVIDGTNHDEFRLFTAGEFDLGPNGPLTRREYPGVIALLFGSLAPKILAHYPLAAYQSPDLAFSALMTDWVFSCQTHEANGLLAKYTPTYSYEFADERAPEIFLPPVSFRYGSAHASELQFLWDEFAHPRPDQLSGAERTLAGDMTGYWTQFAATGDPNGGTNPHWPVFAATADDVEGLVTPAPAPFRTFAKDHQCGFWRAFPPPDIACILAGNCKPGKAYVGDDGLEPPTVTV